MCAECLPIGMRAPERDTASSEGVGERLRTTDGDTVCVVSSGVPAGRTLAAVVCDAEGPPRSMVIAATATHPPVNGTRVASPTVLATLSHGYAGTG